MSESLTVYAKDFGDFQPVYDARRGNAPTIIDGKNFINDVDGPRSGYASYYRDFQFLDPTMRSKVTSLSVGVETWYGTPYGLFRVDPVSGYYIPLISVVTSDPYWPWSVAEVGNMYYFAQKNIGLWQFNPTNGKITLVTGLPFTNVKFICESYGRLIALSDTVVAYSSQDDGTDFVPSLTTGAGAQALSLLSENAFRVDAVSDGFLVATDKGLISGQYVLAAYIFHFDVTSRDLRLFSPNAAAVIPDVGVVYFDNAGFRVTNTVTKVPELWQPAMGEYFRQNVLNTLDRTKIGLVQLFYSDGMRALFVSFAPNTREGVFETTEVYLVSSGRWGPLSQAHLGIIDYAKSENNVVVAGYVGLDGYVHLFENTTFIEQAPAYPYVFLDLVRRVVEERNIALYAGADTIEVQVGYTYINTTSYDPQWFPSGLATGVYYINDDPYDDTHIVDGVDPDMDVSGTPLVGGTYGQFFESGGIERTAKPYSLPEIGLNAVIKVGPFRFAAQQQADETSMISSLIIGCKPSQTFVVYEDWNLEDESQSENWNTAEGNENWGEGFAIPDSFTTELIATDDGVNAQAPQGAELLTVVDNMGGSLYYSPSGFSAIYHLLQISALDVGDGFALKFVNIAGALTGRHI